MRQLLFSLLPGFLFFYANSQKETIQSKIEKVTVFMKGAQVERSARQNLTAGKYNIVFDGISPKIEKQSIQLNAEGKLTILSVTHQVNFLKEQQVQEEIKQIESQKAFLLDKIDMEKNMQNVYKQEEQMIIKNQSIKGDNATLKASELKEAVDFQRQRLTEIYQKLQENDHNLKKMDTDLQKFNKQLTELNQKKDLSTSEIIVAIDVKEANSGDLLLAGRALICPGNRHMKVKRMPLGDIVVLSDEEKVSGHRPSVDVLYRSVAQEFGRDSIGLIMTGMGEDGAEALGEIKNTGGMTIAQDEESCVVYGMPRAAIDRGNVVRVVPLDALANTLVAQCSEKSRVLVQKD